MSTETNNFEKFVIKQIVNSVEYNPETDDYKINRIHISDELINNIAEEGERYGFSREESIRYISLIANNIKTSPSIDIINSSFSVEDIKYGVHLKINIVHSIKGKRFLDLISLGANSFYLIDSNISGLKCGDNLKALDRDWYISYHIDFQIFRGKNRIPDNLSILHLGTLESIEIYNPSIINDILDSEETFSYTEQTITISETTDESDSINKPSNPKNYTINKLISLIKKHVKSNKIENEYKTLLNICQNLSISSYVLNLLIITEKKNNPKEIENIPFDEFLLIKNTTKPVEINSNENSESTINIGNRSEAVVESQTESESVDENQTVLESVVDNRGMFKRPFNFFKGRIRRSEYVISLIIYYIGISTSSMFGLPIFFFIYIILIWFIWAQGSKRCHDRGNSGWFQLIPFYGFWMVFADSEPGINKYGNNPKERKKY